MPVQRLRLRRSRRSPAANDARRGRARPDASRPTIDGFVTGVRFYKGTGNTGTHIGSLWTLDRPAARLRSPSRARRRPAGRPRTFTAAGAGHGRHRPTSCRTRPPAGTTRRSRTPSALAGARPPPRSRSPAASAPPRPASTAAPGTFPQQQLRKHATTTSTCVFTHRRHHAADRSAASGRWPVRPACPTGTTVSVVLSKPLGRRASAPDAKDASGAAVAGTTTYDATTRTITFTPTRRSRRLRRRTRRRVTAVDATAPASAVPADVVVHDGRGRAGRRARAAARSSTSRRCPPRSRTPTPVPVTLGVRFASSVDGTVTGVRFYKGAEQHRHARRHALGRRRHQPLAQATFTRREHDGLADPHVRHAGAHHQGHRVRRVVPHRRSAGTRPHPTRSRATGLQRAPLRTTAASGVVHLRRRATRRRPARPATWSTSSSPRTRRRWSRHGPGRRRRATRAPPRARRSR